MVTYREKKLLDSLNLSEDVLSQIERVWMTNGKIKENSFYSIFSRMLSPLIAITLLAGYLYEEVMPFTNIVIVILWVFMPLGIALFTLLVYLTYYYRPDNLGAEPEVRQKLLLSRGFIKFCKTESLSKKIYGLFLTFTIFVCLALIQANLTAFFYLITTIVCYFSSLFIRDSVHNYINLLEEESELKQ